MRNAILFLVAAAATIEAETLNTGQLDNFIREQMANAMVPNVAVCVVDKDRVLYQGTFGQISGTADSTSPTTPFLIASMSKSITAFATMRLVEQGSLELDTPFDSYLPKSMLGKSDAWEGVTARHLLNHTSGIPRPAFDMGSDPRQARRDAPPGQQFAYTNLHYEMLGRVITESSGITYAEYVHENVFKPLGMSSTHAVQSSLAAKSLGLIPAYQSVLGLPLPWDENGLAAECIPAGGILSTADDMGRFLRVQLNGGYLDGREILSPSSLQEMYRPWNGTEKGYGMGWVITERNGLRTIEHSGQHTVFTSQMVVFPELDRAVVILTNVNSGVFYSGVRDLFDGIVRITAGRRPGSYRRQDWTVRLGIIAFMVAEVLITACLIVVWARSKFARGLSCSRTRVALCVLNITVPVFVSWTLLRWSGISLLTLLNLEPDIGIALAASATMLVSASPLWLVCQVMPTLR